MHVHVITVCHSSTYGSDDNFHRGGCCHSVVALCLITCFYTVVQFRDQTMVWRCSLYSICESADNWEVTFKKLNQVVFNVVCSLLKPALYNETKRRIQRVIMFSSTVADLGFCFSLKRRPDLSHILIRSGFCPQAVSSHNTGNCTVRMLPYIAQMCTCERHIILWSVWAVARRDTSSYTSAMMSSSLFKNFLYRH